MNRAVTVTEMIEVPCRQEDALAVIWAIENIYKTEVKVATVQKLPQTARTGTYKARGYFAFVPWHNEFFYTLHDHGFHSVEAHPPASGSRIHGGFSVVSTGAQDCIVLHYEHAFPAMYIETDIVTLHRVVLRHRLGRCSQRPRGLLRTIPQ